MKAPTFLALIAATMAWPAAAQPAGGQTGGTSPATNPATPMQQQPSGTAPGSTAAAMGPKEFALNAAIANKFEVIESQLALRQASDAKLKEFAELMIREHTAALEELQMVARRAGADVPAEIAPDAAHQAKINAIKNRKDADFDQAYRTDQIQAHDQAVAMLDSYAQSGSNVQLKAWAAKTLPTVRKHRDQLHALPPSR
jgi:putative membrane protein